MLCIKARGNWLSVNLEVARLCVSVSVSVSRLAHHTDTDTDLHSKVVSFPSQSLTANQNVVATADFAADLLA